MLTQNFTMYVDSPNTDSSFGNGNGKRFSRKYQPSKSLPLAAASIRLDFICLRRAFLLSVMLASSPPMNKDTYFSDLGKNCPLKCEKAFSV